jgi:MerR family transcriptional regulator, redox-sensitive transcriptional activator SoxR
MPLQPGLKSRLSIGEVARRTGRRASSIRYYESIGLLPEPPRVGGRRVYGEETVRALSVVATAQRAGLTLDEIRLLLGARGDDAASVDRLREVAERKLPEIEAQLERTALVKAWLEAAADCRCPTLDDCPLFDEA